MSNTTERTILEAGDTAPSFTLTDDHGNEVSLSDFAGRKVLVYFYPRANTPGCTTEACDFRDSLTSLNGAGIDVLGISPDTVDKLTKFRDDHELTFPLLSDPSKEVLTAYGAFGEKKNYGKVVQGVIRSTFLVDEEGKIALAKYNVKATGHVARIIKEIA
ncbi:MAG: thioredoxin-dependent thiol peroxidase [Mycobacteriaceae bacterium]|uniref:thioredoxin-dependent thiol peroxidase n=1 Tax=Corynebacterium sp. TaxID=1720 RepID=UPI003F951C2E